eukprot:CAMPEP_0181178388 /NCGR_PEP_ID=MMETSP1096-20121128/5698_1 /TAXON_ID=156174 ORGANISM="Chrysochromulina ericina, Strain CCMP281" /NCGR_SAMPLE_ID=MMETSP1096 /ASSEMBLY_ACC=CAM_ASM_000453 /LENGTH=137 /DNA_ID=CAMNT_0023266663 /DNA_START=533 /DNA_END=943 /DNA_ORIENTATION=-
MWECGGRQRECCGQTPAHHSTQLLPHTLAVLPWSRPYAVDSGQQLALTICPGCLSPMSEAHALDNSPTYILVRHLVVDAELAGMKMSVPSLCHNRLVLWVHPELVPAPRIAVVTVHYVPEALVVRSEHAAHGVPFNL